MSSTASSKQVQKNIVQLSLPMAGTQLITMGSGFLCMSMLATLGHEVLAASALLFSISVSLLVTGFSLLFSSCILISHAYGAKEYLKIGGLVQQTWMLALLLSIPIMLVFWYIYPILIFFKQEPAIAKIVEEFMQANIWRIAPLNLAICNQQLCYAIHKQKIDFVANMLGVVILLATAYVLILGKFGFPTLGVTGLAYAINLQAIFYFIFTLGCMIFMKEFRSFKLFQLRLRQHWHDLIDLIKIGWPISVQIGSEMLGFMVCSILIGWLSTNALAAAQIYIQYEFLIVVPYFALSQAGGILIGQAYGSKSYSDIRMIGSICLRIAAVISFLVAILLCLFPQFFASFYIDIHDPANAEIVNMMGVLFVILAASQFFDSIRHVLTGILRGLLDAKYPMYIGVIGIWCIGLPISYLLAFPLKLGVAGIMLGGVIGIIVGMIILLFRWHTMSKHS